MSANNLPRYELKKMTESLDKRIVKVIQRNIFCELSIFGEKFMMFLNLSCINIQYKIIHYYY